MTGTSQTPITNLHGSWWMGGSDLLADVPEEVDQGDGGSAEDRGAAGDQDADLPTGGQVRVGAVGTESPHHGGNDEREDGEDKPDGHHGTDDGETLRVARQTSVVGLDVDLHRSEEHTSE